MHIQGWIYRVIYTKSTNGPREYIDSSSTPTTRGQSKKLLEHVHKSAVENELILDISVKWSILVIYRCSYKIFFSEVTWKRWKIFPRKTKSVVLVIWEIFCFKVGSIWGYQCVQSVRRYKCVHLLGSYIEFFFARNVSIYQNFRTLLVSWWNDEISEIKVDVTADKVI